MRKMAKKHVSMKMKACLCTVGSRFRSSVTSCNAVPGSGLLRPIPGSL